SPASCVTVTPIGLISTCPIAFTETMPERDSLVVLSVTDTRSVLPSESAETLIQSLAAPETSCSHSVFTASTTTLRLLLPVAPNEREEGFTVTEAVLSGSGDLHDTAMAAPASKMTE